MTSKTISAVALAGFMLVSVGCDQQSSGASSPARPTPRAAAAPQEPAPDLDPKFDVEVAEDSPLWKPKSEAMNQQAPDKFNVTFTTSRGKVVIEVDRSLSPAGADRFYNLSRHGFYNGERFFRVIPRFMAQFGLHGNPKITQLWRNATIPDEPVKTPNKPGMVTFAKTAAPNSRTTQLFINYRDNGPSLDRQGFAPFGRVVKGMDVVESLYKEYGEGAPHGRGPDQMQLMSRGNAYLSESFPNLDYIISTEVKAAGEEATTQPVEDAPAEDDAAKPDEPAGETGE